MRTLFSLFLSLLLLSALQAQHRPLLSNPTPVVELNTSGEEFAPLLLNGGLCYTATADVGQPGAAFRSELMWSSLRENGTQAAPERFSTELSSTLHERTLASSGAGDVLVFARNHHAASRASVDYLYMSRRGSLDYQAAEALPFNDERFNTTHPSLDPTGTRLIFASDRPGGFGGYDLYYAERTANGWGAPINLGPQLNSKYDELYPSWSNEGILSFSSDRLGGDGGLDLYIMDIASPVWGKPIHLAAPLSSPADDCSVTWDVASGRGFLSSNRAGGLGGMDLYAFHFDPTDGRGWLPQAPASAGILVVGDYGRVSGNVTAGGQLLTGTGSARTWQTLGTPTSQEVESPLAHLCVGDRLATTGDTVTAFGVRLELTWSDLHTPVVGAKVMAPGSGTRPYTTDQQGGVCLPFSGDDDVHYALEVPGGQPEELTVPGNRLFLHHQATPEVARDTATLELTFEVDAAVTIAVHRQLRDRLAALASLYGRSGYSLDQVEASILASITAPAAEQLESKCLSALAQSRELTGLAATVAVQSALAPAEASASETAVEVVPRGAEITLTVRALRNDVMAADDKS